MVSARSRSWSARRSSWSWSSVTAAILAEASPEEANGGALSRRLGEPERQLTVIGERTWIGPFCSLDGTGGLKLGHHCMVSLGCQLLTHDTARWALSGGVADYEYAATEIGECCFLGTLAVVTKGVTMGEHSLVAAGTVVTGDVDPYSIVAGVPARRIGSVATADDGAVSLRYD